MTSKDTAYWNSRYGMGGTSGAGSIGLIRDWKWSVIEKYVTDLDDFIDIGCGDREFWKGRSASKYVGVDLSSVLIERHKPQYPEFRFVCAGGEERLEGLHAKVVLCLDMLFHVLDDAAYSAILENLAHYSRDWIFIYTWRTNPFATFGGRIGLLRARQFSRFLRSFVSVIVDDGLYQKYRKFNSYYPVIQNQGFELIAVEENVTLEPHGAMWVFRKVCTS